jgi:hypothetical protein
MDDDGVTYLPSIWTESDRYLAGVTHHDRRDVAQAVNLSSQAGTDIRAYYAIGREAASGAGGALTRSGFTTVHTCHDVTMARALARSGPANWRVYVSRVDSIGPGMSIAGAPSEWEQATPASLGLWFDWAPISDDHPAPLTMSVARTPVGRIGIVVYCGLTCRIMVAERHESEQATASGVNVPTWYSVSDWPVICWPILHPTPDSRWIVDAYSGGDWHQWQADTIAGPWEVTA